MPFPPLCTLIIVDAFGEYANELNKADGLFCSVLLAVCLHDSPRRRKKTSKYFIKKNAPLNLEAQI